MTQDTQSNAPALPALMSAGMVQELAMNLAQYQQLLVFSGYDYQSEAGFVVELRLQHPKRPATLFLNSSLLRPVLYTRAKELEQYFQDAGINVNDLVEKTRNQLILAGVLSATPEQPTEGGN